MQDLENNAEVWCVMLELVQEIGTKLRAHKKKAGGIAISIRNNELFTKGGSAGLAFRHKAHLSGETRIFFVCRELSVGHTDSFSDGSGNQPV